MPSDRKRTLHIRMKIKEFRMPYYLTTHNEPTVTRETVETRWREMARERRAFWVKTWFTHDQGRRFCWWDAPNREVLELIFDHYKVSWDEIIEVEMTTPSDWRWRED